MLTRHARHIALLALLGCAGHAPATPAVIPAAAPACVADTTSDTLRVDVTDSTRQFSPVRTCEGRRWTFVIRKIDPRAARDALDAGIDVLVTADPAAIAYAATRSDYDSAPLPWDRLYVLALPDPAPDTSRVSALRVDLAANAVRVEARPAESPPPCGVAPTATTIGRPRLLYADDDSVARGLAERLVALADRPGAPVPASLAAAGSRLRAIGVPPKAIGGRVDDGAYVLQNPIGAQTTCLRYTVVTLIETRPRVIVRRAAARLSTDSVGTVHLEPLAAGP
ncbi:MAG TPA: hypothetical protein VNW46_07940 [Gemmatimonadaceae bacterium]|nr:hypothetical protein [Gemmatimonadaceae bacterium]